MAHTRHIEAGRTSQKWKDDADTPMYPPSPARSVSAQSHHEISIMLISARDTCVTFEVVGVRGDDADRIEAGLRAQQLDP